MRSERPQAVATPLSRRTFVKGAAASLAMLPLGALLSACGGEPAADSAGDAGGQSGSAADATSEQPASQGAAEESAAEGQAAAAGSSVLVAYFSATGNTRGVAEAIAAHLGADTFEITPAQPYAADDLNYNDSSSRTSRERGDAGTVVELTQVVPEGFDGYDTVFVGYPIWWGDASWVVDGFVSGNDFSGKTVVPFCTSASSSLGSSGQNLATLAGTGDWLPGARFAGGAAESEVTAWVDGLGL